MPPPDPDQPEPLTEELPAPLAQMLTALLGVETFPGLLAVLALIRIPLLRWYLLTAPPAPKITSHAGGGLVAPGTNETVTFTTNAPEVSHELCLIPKAAFGAPAPAAVSHVPIPASVSSPLPSPFTTTIPIPAGGGVEYYLEVGVHADVPEQQRHRLRVKTPAPLAATFAGVPPPNPAPAAPYPAPANINFTVRFTGGFPPYSFFIIWGDGTTHPTTSVPDSNPVGVPHAYRNPGKFFPVLVYSDSRTPTPSNLSGGEYNVS